jgi:hypothetical protein
MYPFCELTTTKVLAREAAAVLDIIVCVMAIIDYTKQLTFIRLRRSSKESNTKAMIRDA